jgi:alpha-tubulin suppressor-like RCC1 family protein
VLDNNSVPTKIKSNNVFDNKNISFVKISDNNDTNYTYYALKKGTIYAWGSNTMGQLGNNSTTNSSEPIKVNDANGFVNGSVSNFDAKYGAVLAISNGTIYTWGQLTDRLGDSDLPTENTPVKFSQNTADGFQNKNVSSVSIGGTMSYAVENDTCYYWGPGLYGEDVEDISDYKAKPLLNWASNNSVESVKTSNEQAALLKDGHIYTFGYGELGSKTVDDYTYIPKVVPSNNGFTNNNINGYWVGNSITIVLQGDTFYVWGYLETDSAIALLSHKPISVDVP